MFIRFKRMKWNYKCLNGIKIYIYSLIIIYNFFNSIILNICLSFGIFFYNIIII